MHLHQADSVHVASTEACSAAGAPLCGRCWVTSQGAERGHGEARLRTSLVSAPAPPVPPTVPACQRGCTSVLFGGMHETGLQQQLCPPALTRWAAYSQGNDRSDFVRAWKWFGHPPNRAALHAATFASAGSIACTGCSCRLDTWMGMGRWRLTYLHDPAGLCPDLLQPQAHCDVAPAAAAAGVAPAPQALGGARGALGPAEWAAAAAAGSLWKQSVALRGAL